ncbi:thioredoxin family protein [Colwellia sp. PAMC 21821]|uniref:thioredoxin family protein n=1 Tax=Colwellia sp. PAMC 21821 TaxID=1816219 RepID=UPI0009BD12FE|nr:thioredoxin family protein [Colwellia sp. PAMC 21821]ARD43719.1 hypothetical protein A3Q33_05010 [Colwellia sp. PAMC 21821]
MNRFSAILISIILIFVSACANSQADNKSIAIGEISQQQLMQDHSSFQQSYLIAKLSDAEITEINTWPRDLQVEVYFGTWCHDSQREVPKFLKILAENSTISSRLFGLDYTKSEPSGRAKIHDIKYTPTFIVYQNNREIGRIIERPKVSLIADISAML